MKPEDLQKQLSDINVELLNSISLIIFEIENNTKNDLFMLANILDEKSLARLIDYYDGSEIKMPSKNEYKQNLILALYFYLIEIKGYNFKKATDMMKDMSNLQVEESEQYIGRRLSKVKEKLKERLILLINNL